MISVNPVVDVAKSFGINGEPGGNRTHNLQIKSGPRDAIATRHTRNGGHVERPSLFHLRSREHPGTEAEPKMVRICPLKSVARGVLR
jgi:hypothetical protein